MALEFNDSTPLVEYLTEYSSVKPLPTEVDGPKTVIEAINKVNFILRAAKFLSQRMDFSFIQLETDFVTLSNDFAKFNEYYESLSKFAIKQDKVPDLLNFNEAFQKVRRHIRELVILYDVYHFEDSFSKKEKLESLITELKEGREEVKKTVAESHQILETSKTAEAKIGVNHYAGLFRKQSRTYFIYSWIWLGFLVLAICALIKIGMSDEFLKIDKEATPAEITEVVFKKVILISGIFYLIGLFSKNYRANKHNEIVNKHRQNALNTFLIFVDSVQEGADKNQTKNAVLLKATETIFSSQATGFLPDSSDGDMSPKIIEIFKNFPTQAAK